MVEKGVALLKISHLSISVTSELGVMVQTCCPSTHEAGGLLELTTSDSLRATILKKAFVNTGEQVSSWISLSSAVSTREWGLWVMHICRVSWESGRPFSEVVSCIFVLGVMQRVQVHALSSLWCCQPWVRSSDHISWGLVMVSIV